MDRTFISKVCPKEGTRVRVPGFYHITKWHEGRWGLFLFFIPCFRPLSASWLSAAARGRAPPSAARRRAARARCRAHVYSLARDLHWGRALRNQL